MNLHIYPEKAANWQQELANVVTDPNELLSLLNLNPQEFTKDIQTSKVPLLIFRKARNLGHKFDPLPLLATG